MENNKITLDVFNNEIGNYEEVTIYAQDMKDFGVEKPFDVTRFYEEVLNDDISTKGAIKVYNKMMLALYKKSELKEIRRNFGRTGYKHIQVLK